MCFVLLLLENGNFIIILDVMKKIFLHSFLLLFSAFMAAMAFPNFIFSSGFPILSFFYLIPIFYLLNRSNIFLSSFYGLIYGFVFYLFYNYWLKTFHPLAILIAPILESFQYFLLFGLLSLCSKIFEKRAYIVQSICYTAYFYITQQGFLSYPYGNITAAVYKFLPFIQIVDIGGIWILAFIMVLPQALIAKLIDIKPIMEIRRYRYDILILILVYLTTFIYGFSRIAYYEKKKGEILKIATIQHSADSWENGQLTYKKNFETLKRLSLEALLYNPDMIIWSETAFVPSLSWHTLYPSSSFMSNLCMEFFSFGTELSVPLVTGNPEGIVKKSGDVPFLEDGSFNWKTYNSVILFGNNKLLKTYRKQHLVPFTEYFPYEKELPWLYELLLKNDYVWWEKGDESVVFEYDDIKFSTPICFEDTFGYLSADFVRSGADLLINLSNDSWSKSVAAEIQHLQLATFRAIENRRPMIRGTNSGITCYVDIVGRVNNPLPPFEECYGLYEIELYKEKGFSFYTKVPDLFGKLSVLLSVFLLAYGLFIWPFNIRREALFKKYGNLFSSLDDYYEV